ncbi:hypothetical protein B0H14DRAFT_2568499 [Mycena olivaceomarginata]|nr:hypothetical protein B0H14DRAFT_2568499 [Mycena olivaceomarginata]
MDTGVCGARPSTSSIAVAVDVDVDGAASCWSGDPTRVEARLDSSSDSITESPVPPQPLSTQATSVSTTPLPPPPVPSAHDSQSQTGAKSLPPPPPNTSGDKKGAKRARLVLRVREEPAQDLHQPPIKQIKQIKPCTSRAQKTGDEPPAVVQRRSTRAPWTKTPNPAQKSQGPAPKQNKKKWPGWAVIDSNGKESTRTRSTIPRPSTSGLCAKVEVDENGVHFLHEPITGMKIDISDDESVPLVAKQRSALDDNLVAIDQTTAKLQELQDQVLNQDTCTKHCLDASLRALCAFGTTESQFATLTRSMAAYTAARGTLPRPEISLCSQPGSGAITPPKDLCEELNASLSPPLDYSHRHLEAADDALSHRRQRSGSFGGS